MKLFAVYGECVCGWRCACGEGARWPVCPECGEQVMPPQPTSHVQRMGFVGEIWPEQEALERADASLAPRGEALTLRLGNAGLPRIYSPSAYE